MTIDVHTFFREMTVRICGSLDLDLALQHAFEYAAAHVPMDALALGYFDPAKGAIQMLAKVGRDVDRRCCNRVHG